MGLRPAQEGIRRGEEEVDRDLGREDAEAIGASNQYLGI
jgi:hypothetical protein